MGRPMHWRHVISASRIAPTIPMTHKHSITVRGQRTAISVEDAFWAKLIRFARDDCLTVAELLAEIGNGRRTKSRFSSAVRLYVLDRVEREHRMMMAALAGDVVSG